MTIACAGAVGELAWDVACRSLGWQGGSTIALDVCLLAAGGNVIGAVDRVAAAARVALLCLSSRPLAVCLTVCLRVRVCARAQVCAVNVAF